MTDMLAEPDLNPFTRDKYAYVTVRALEEHRDDGMGYIFFEDVQDLGRATRISVYAHRTEAMIDAGAIPSIWLADFDPSMVWAIPGFVDGLGVAVHYEFTTPDPMNFCDAVTKENGND